MPKLETSTTHKTHYRKTFDRHELKRLLAEAVAKEAGIRNLSSSNVDFKVEFQDETEGSPSYRVGTRAVVTIDVDHRDAVSGDPDPGRPSDP